MPGSDVVAEDNNCVCGRILAFVEMNFITDQIVERNLNVADDVRQTICLTSKLTRGLI